MRNKCFKRVWLLTLIIASLITAFTFTIFMPEVKASTTGSISGTIKDPQGLPIDNVVVILFPSTDSGKIGNEIEYYIRDKTSLDGSYSLLNIPIGIYNILYAEVNYDYAFHRVDNIVISNGESLTINVTLTEGGSLSGTVRKDNFPAENVFIFLTQNGWLYGLSEGTDQNGNYLIPHVEPGTYNIRAVFPDNEFGKVIAVVKNVTIVSQTTTNQDIDLNSTAIGHLFVEARDNETNSLIPVDDILLKDEDSIIISSATIYTNNHSCGFIVGLPTGLTYTVKVTASGYAPCELTGINISSGFGNKVTCMLQAVENSTSSSLSSTAEAVNHCHDFIMDHNEVNKEEKTGIWSWVLGQPCDLTIAIEKVTWENKPWPEKNCKYPWKVTFEVALKWHTIWGADFWGNRTNERVHQAEDGMIFSDADSCDILWVSWKSADYVLEEKQTEPKPRASGGKGQWDGVMYDPVPERVGQLTREGTGESAFDVYRYKIALELNPDKIEELKKKMCTGERVKPPAVPVKIEYIHSYDGVLHSYATGVSIGVGFPPSISVGIGFTLKNNHAWKMDKGPDWLPRPEYHCPRCAKCKIERTPKYKRTTEAIIGEPFEVTLSLDINENNPQENVTIVEWIPTSFKWTYVWNPIPTEYDATLAKWVFYGEDARDRDITYTVIPNALGTYHFSGLQVDDDGVELPTLGENSVTVLETPVGGTVTPVNKLALLAPWIVLAALIAIAGASVVVYRRRR